MLATVIGYVYERLICFTSKLAVRTTKVAHFVVWVVLWENIVLHRFDDFLRMLILHSRTA